jgi:hypothetical protein
MPKQEPEEDDDWDFGGESYKPPCPVASKIKKDSGQGYTNLFLEKQLKGLSGKAPF